MIEWFYFLQPNLALVYKVKWFQVLLYICYDVDQRKARGTQKGLIEKNIYSSNRSKIQVNLVKQ